MNSFHQSRGRVAFEVLCTMTVSASCAAAWMQTGATAFLPAALATGVYGLWHLTDMRRPSDAAVVTEQAEHTVPRYVADPEPLVVEVAEQAPKPRKRSRRKQPETAEAIIPVEVAEPEASPGFPDRAAIEEELHPPIAPLFEPKPFPIQLRPRFGRKAG